MSFLQSNIKNWLLRVILESDFGLIEPYLEYIDVQQNFAFSDAHEIVQYIYFIENGLGSVLGYAENKSIEIGIFGRDGMSSTAVILGSVRSPHKIVGWIAGSALRIKTDDFRRALDASLSLRQIFLHYVQAFLVQIAENAVSNGMLTIEQRLARWLLMCRARTESDEIDLTHELLSMMLGVQRPGVTLAIQGLEAALTIRAKRGRLLIVDAEKLRQITGGSYGIPEAEYRRLLGHF